MHFAFIFWLLLVQNVGRLGTSQMNRYNFHILLTSFHLSTIFELIYVKITHKHASVIAKQTERGLLLAPILTLTPAGRMDSVSQPYFFL
jgi:hypothetical protein